MSTELTVKNSGALIEAIDKNGLGDILKPLVQEIHLFDSYVAGTAFLQDKSVLESLNIGDKLKLIREENKFDENAIQIFTEDGKKLGYVPEKDNIIFARLMDAGKMLAAKIKDMEIKGSFTRISIGIYLVDF
ncbi:MAG: HIRAN domain-containing protein [Oscillospiraceae bacterium]|nr:HIRAN domain-containing protein [Oscillospiraceae bacterium]